MHNKVNVIYGSRIRTFPFSWPRKIQKTSLKVTISIFSHYMLKVNFLHSYSSAKPCLEFFSFFGAVIKTFTVTESFIKHYTGKFDFSHMTSSLCELSASNWEKTLCCRNLRSKVGPILTNTDRVLLSYALD